MKAEVEVDLPHALSSKKTLAACFRLYNSWPQPCLRAILAALLLAKGSLTSSLARQ